MKNRLMAAVMAMLLAVPFVAVYSVDCGVDANARDTVRIVPVVVPVVTPGQLIEIPVYLYSDEDISGFSLGFKWTGNSIRYSSATLNPDLVNMGFSPFISRKDTITNIIGLGMANLAAGSLPASNQYRLMYTVKFMTKNGAVPSLIVIDSSFFPPAGPFLLAPASGGTGNGICPEYVHSTVDIRLGDVRGDADGDGIISIADVVYLINYIFSGGPTPTPFSSGDADCSGAINIADAVYLINYIFGGGPMPCEG